MAQYQVHTGALYMLLAMCDTIYSVDGSVINTPVFSISRKI